MWLHLLTALGLLFVLEGILPFLTPHGMRRAMLQTAQLPDKVLRIIGLVSMLLGLVMLYVLHG
ncbi:DUF2065 domain-containing protein [Acidihalobacter ferrooxydans]|uniref:DUF2065 domain-containing protein n=1 Tax=Acidihalobacter ferrooxydans TaxID=1765967 RepID=A0A1P8UI82_9GAMM|nr:DUF2065 domain-containing protein [Acidihalobacter ferrooxydans]APZ43542.1 hypothetical protein BW247_10955 [Acidihalobacter ferrooxydans]